MNKKVSTHHQFAFYISNLTDQAVSISIGQNIQVVDESVFHRLFHVLRIDIGDVCIFFDKNINILVELISASGKKKITCLVLKKEANKQLQPSITFLLPLLKRDHFQTALYSLSELGVNNIIPILVDKGQRRWGGVKEFERSQKILVAAAEQSKNFSFPELLAPKTVQEVCDDLQDDSVQRIFFDPSGERLVTVIPRVQGKDLIFLVGPEGDMSQSEKNILQQNYFLFCALTPTVLRAVQAVAVSVGIFRTLGGR